MLFLMKILFHLKTMLILLLFPPLNYPLSPSFLLVLLLHLIFLLSSLLFRFYLHLHLHLHKLYQLVQNQISTLFIKELLVVNWKCNMCLILNKLHTFSLSLFLMLNFTFCNASSMSFPSLSLKGLIRGLLRIDEPIISFLLQATNQLLSQLYS